MKNHSIAFSVRHRFDGDDAKELLRSEPLLQQFRICAGGILRQQGTHRVSRERHGYDGLLLCTGGRGEAVLDGKPFVLTENDLFWTSRSWPHHYRSSRQDPYDLVWFSLQGKWVTYVIGKAGLTRDQPLRHLEAGARVAETWERLIRQLAARNDTASLVHGSAQLMEGICRLGMERTGAAERADPFAARAISLMEENLQNPPSLPALAQNCGCSVQYLCRRFKQAAGTSPGQYLMRLRIRRATELLQEDMTLEEIATELGFCDQYHFSRTFKKVEGLPPGEYRRALHA